MAHDTSASVRARYLPVSGDEVTRGAPSNGIDYIVTVGRRRKWWWESGPVDTIWSRETGPAVLFHASLLISILRVNLVLTYEIPPDFSGGAHLFVLTIIRHRVLLLLPLEDGIVILAGLKVAASSFLLWIFDDVKAAVNTVASDPRLTMEREKYENSCLGDSHTMTAKECHLLERHFKLLQSRLDAYNHPPAIYYVYEHIMYIALVVGLAGGIAGLVAGCGRNTLAAKLFFWSGLAGLFFRTALEAVSFAAGPISSISIAYVEITAVVYLFAIYFTKVSWSYYAVLKAREVNTSPGDGSAIELRGISDGDGRSGATV